MKTRWLDRRVAAPGPYIALCLSQDEFDSALKHIKQPVGKPWILGNRADATAHHFENNNGEIGTIVCISGWEGRDSIEIAGLLVHESVHIWQHYAESIGETEPAAEQEAYAIQEISQTLMAEFARRMKA